MIDNKARGMRVKALALTAALGLIGMMLAGEASAECWNVPSPPAATRSSRFVAAVYRPDETRAAAWMPVLEEERAETPSIVGLWKVEFHAKGNTGIPDGFLIDFGVVAWHDDGTEIMNSGMRDPSTGNFCMGAWRQVGASTFKLNHIGLSWQSGTYQGSASIQELVTVAPSGNSYQGSFVITQYLGSEFDESTIAPPTPIHGVVTGTRVTVN
ncbi:MAG: hypothetical protein ACHQDD_10245 [Steroidobacterales bacterium]